MSEVGREIRRLREEKGWTQIELAFRSRLNPSSVNLIESGKRNPSAGSLTKIAGALDVEVGDLFPKDQLPLDLDKEDEALVRDLIQRVKADELSVSAALDAMRARGILQPRRLRTTGEVESVR
jgi:transcriptional regulator with XRE-family HTH domain